MHISQQDIDNIRTNLKLRVQRTEITDKGGGPSPTNNDTATDTIDETRIPHNFTMTAHPHGTVGSDTPMGGGKMIGNPQTDDILSLLGLDHIITTPYLFASSETNRFTKSQFCSNEQTKESFQMMDLDQNGLQPRSHHQDGTVDSKSRHHQPDANEINLESDSESEESRTNNKEPGLFGRQPLSSDANNLDQCSSKQNTEGEGNLIKHQPDLNEIELDSDSEQSESNGITKGISDSNEIDLESE